MWSFSSVSHFFPLVRRVDLTSRLVKSCGLHRIPSTVFSPAPAPNPFLRNRPYLLPPPEDALELGERIHTLYVLPLFDFRLHPPLFFAIPNRLTEHSSPLGPFAAIQVHTPFATPNVSSLSCCRFNARDQSADHLVGLFFHSIGVHQL